LLTVVVPVLLILRWFQYLLLLLACLCLLLMRFAYRCCTCYFFMENSISSIIAGVTLSLADYICLPSLHSLLILRCQYLVLLLAWLCLLLMKARDTAMAAFPNPPI
jgi:hypothetical protein